MSGSPGAGNLDEVSTDRRAHRRPHRKEPPMTTESRQRQDTAIPTQRTEQEQAMTDAIRSGDNETVLRILSTSVALLPQDGDDDGEPQPEGTISLPMIEHEGNSYIAIFTSETALIAAGGDPGSAVSLPLAELAASWPSDELWMAVNPATEDGISLPPDVVNALPVYAMSAEQGDGSPPDAMASDGGHSGESGQTAQTEAAAQAAAEQPDDTAGRNRSDDSG
jgi:type IV secretory pathway VirJ component